MSYVVGVHSIWTAVAVLGLLWHYVHDTPDGINWLWPWRDRNNKWAEAVLSVDHDKWLEKTWCRFSYRGVVEIVLGTFALVAVSQLIPKNLLLLCCSVGVGTFMTAFVFWASQTQENPA